MLTMTAEDALIIYEAKKNEEIELKLSEVYVSTGLDDNDRWLAERLVRDYALFLIGHPDFMHIQVIIRLFQITNRAKQSAILLSKILQYLNLFDERYVATVE